MIDLRFQDELGNLSIAINVSLLDNGITGLLGPSGAGKSTLLRFIAGLHHTPKARRTGYIKVGTLIWHDSTRIWTPCHRRNVGFVFQDLQLFSHLTVRDNLLYPLRRRVTDRRTPEMSRFDDLIRRTGTEHLQHRSIHNLSGGEARRVALVRALVTQPDLLLLDEPFAALDALRRSEWTDWLGTLCREQGVPALYVSHQVGELASLADNVVIMDQGQVLASGTARDVLATMNLPHIIPEPINLVPRALQDGSKQRTLSVPASGLLILPHDTPMSGPLAAALSTKQATVTAVQAHGSSRMAIRVITHGDDGGVPMVATLDAEAFGDLGVAPGARVTVAWRRAP